MIISLNIGINIEIIEIIEIREMIEILEMIGIIQETILETITEIIIEIVVIAVIIVTTGTPIAHTEILIEIIVTMTIEIFERTDKIIGTDTKETIDTTVTETALKEKDPMTDTIVTGILVKIDIKTILAQIEIITNKTLKIRTCQCHHTIPTWEITVSLTLIIRFSVHAAAKRSISTNRRYLRPVLNANANAA